MEEKKVSTANDQNREISDTSRNSGATNTVDRQEGDMNNGETGGNFKAPTDADQPEQQSPDSPPY